MNFIVKDIASEITNLSHINCEGCRAFYPSFSNHFCYVTDWKTLVGLFFDIAIQKIPEASLYSTEVIYKSLCDFKYSAYGSSDDYETQESY